MASIGTVPANADYNAFAMFAYTDESDGAPDLVMGLNGRFLRIQVIANPDYDAAIHNVAPFNDPNAPEYVPPTLGDPANIDFLFPYLLRQYGIERLRELQGQFQARFTDYDIRMEPIKVSFTYPAPILP